MEKAPVTLPFLCYAISERQKINRIRFNAHALQKKATPELRVKLALLYSDCQTEMKKMTKVISYVKKQLGAETRWGSSCNIVHVKWGNSTYEPKHIERIAENHLLDKCILPELDTFELPASAELMQARYDVLKREHKESL